MTLNVGRLCIELHVTSFYVRIPGLGEASYNRMFGFHCDRWERGNGGH